jgi:hypothetical protein
VKCAVEGCGKEAYHLLFVVGRFGAVQPHGGIWTGMWLCEEHLKALADKLESLGVKRGKLILSGLPPVPDEVKGLTGEAVVVRPKDPEKEVERQ